MIAGGKESTTLAFEAKKRSPAESLRSSTRRLSDFRISMYRRVKAWTLASCKNRHLSRMPGTLEYIYVYQKVILSFLAVLPSLLAAVLYFWISLTIP